MVDVGRQCRPQWFERALIQQQRTGIFRPFGCCCGTNKQRKAAKAMPGGSLLMRLCAGQR
jgi:hypothetical protein